MESFNNQDVKSMSDINSALVKSMASLIKFSPPRFLFQPLATCLNNEVGATLVTFLSPEGRSFSQGKAVSCPYGDDALDLIKSAIEGESPFNKIIYYKDIFQKLPGGLRGVLDSQEADLIYLYSFFPAGNNLPFFGAVIIGGMKGRGFSQGDLTFLEAILRVFSSSVEENTPPYGTAIDKRTSLYTRDHFLAVLSQRLESVKIDSRSHALLSFSLDGFEGFKKVVGPKVADESILSVGKALVRAVRGDDLVTFDSPFGFLVLLCDIHPDCLFSVTERLRESVAKIPLGVTSCHITTSVGGCMIDSNLAPSCEKLLAMTGDALKRSLSRGGDCSTLI